MRFSIRAKQIAGVTALVGVSVVVLSALYVNRLADVVLHESEKRAQLVASAIGHRAREVADTSPTPFAAYPGDPGLRAILESSLYDQSVTWAAIVDRTGMASAHSDRTQVGRPLPPRADLETLVTAGALDKLRVIYSKDGQTLELREPVRVREPQLGSIRIGVSTLLVRQELNRLLRPVLVMTAVALLVSIFGAALLAQLVLRPIHVIRSGLTRLGKGEFGVTLDLPPGDEFGELGTFFNTISQQLSADRMLLAGQKAHLQTAVEHLEDAVALFNPAGELLFTNPAMQSTLPPQAIGRALQGLLIADHPYRRIVEETLASRESRGPVQVSPSPVADAPGAPGVQELLVLTHAIAGTDGELVGVLLVSRNVAYLSRMQSTLAYSRKLVALGRLTAGVAHEVKNPLNAMMIHLELLRTKIRNGQAGIPAAAGARPSTRRDSVTATPTVDGVLQHVEIIESEIRRLDEVVQGFLKFNRPEDLRLQPVRVSAIFAEILPVVDADARTHHVRIEVDCAGSEPTVNADAAMLRQAFLNLAINACQAMPDGGTLRLACAPSGRDRVEVRVEDTGIGIPPADLERIFDLYFTTKDHGTGIGLSMVYRIVQLHDGGVEVQSTPGHGTTFRILLPVAHEI